MFSTMAERIRGLASLFWREVAKFGAVGGVAFVIDNGLFWYLIHGPMSDSEVKARFVSASVATVFAWIANRYWTFRRRRQPNPVRELGMFVLINLIGMGIAAGCVWIAKYPMDITDRPTLFFAGIVGTVLATVLRFVAYRFWVFNAELDEDPAFSHDRELFGHPDSRADEGPVTASTGAQAGPRLAGSLDPATTEPTLPRDQ
ncbi:GtrA family protein [Arthrobacter sp. HLT1-21]